MEYLYGKNINYEDFSSGRVFYHAKGMTNFPVRLAQEIYGRCLQYSGKKDNIRLYDCCCGGGYLLTVLGFLNQDTIGSIYGSDINEEMLEVANKNLHLLSKEGMGNRINEISSMIENYGKQSHVDALAGALRLRTMIKKDIEVTTFYSDVFEMEELSINPDIIIADVPYGDLVYWEGEKESDINRMLDSLLSVCTPDTIIGLCMDKKQKIRNERYIRLEKQAVGKRRFEILKRNNS